MKFPRSLRDLNLYQKILFWTIIFFISYTIIGVFILPPILKSILQKRFTENLNRTVTIEKIKVNPYALSLTMNGFSALEKNSSEEFVSFQTFYANLQSFSIFKLAPVLKHLTVDGLHARIVMNEDGTFNFSDILESFIIDSTEDTAETVTENSEHFEFLVSDIQIINCGVLVIDDQYGVTHTINDIQVTVPFLSNSEEYVEQFTTTDISLTINDAPVVLQGEMKPFSTSRELNMNLEVKAINLAHYSPYAQKECYLTINSGKVDVDIDLFHHALLNGKPKLSAPGKIIITNLEILDDEKQPLLKTVLNELKIADSNIFERNFHVDSLYTKSTEIGITRKPDKTLSIEALMGLFESEKSKNKQKEELPAQLTLDEIFLDDTSIFITNLSRVDEGNLPSKSVLFRSSSLVLKDLSVETGRYEITLGEARYEKGSLLIQGDKDGNLNFQPLLDFSSAKNENGSKAISNERIPWRVTIKQASVTDVDVEARNITPAQNKDIRLHNITLKAKNLSTIPGTQGEIDFTCSLSETGKIQSSGSIAITPPSVNVQVDVSNIDLTLFQPFLPDEILITVENGVLSSEGNVSLLYNDKNNIQAHYQGKTTVNDFAIIDKNTDEYVLAFDALKVNGIDASLSPLSANIENITLHNMFSKALINPDGSISFRNIISSEQNKDQYPETGAQPITDSNTEAQSGSLFTIPVSITTFTIDKGRIEFLDQSVNPNFTLQVTDLLCTVSGLSSVSTDKADVLAEGKIDGNAPFKFTGVANILSNKLFIDMAVKLNDMDLSSFGPYTGKYIGYDVRKGKLSLDVTYLMKERRLDSINKLVIDQFEFGEKVESPDAIEVPLKLALALLKDRYGKITLNVPVEGSFDNPEFSIGKIIIQTIKNTLVKAATAPFRFLASLFGGGENLNYFEFEPGSANISEENKSKLDIIITAMYERPELELEIAGYTDILQDNQVLVTQKYDQLIKKQKLQELNNAGKSAPPLESIIIREEEYKKYAKTAYKDVLKKKQLPIPKMLLEMPISELEDVIKKTIQVTNDDLRVLAIQRAQNVLQYILSHDKVELNRLFLIEPDSLTDKKVEKIKESRVVLGLR